MSILEEQLEKNTLASAYILEGPNEEYNKDFALNFAGDILKSYGLSENPTQSSDVYMIDKGKDIIDIETIREVLKSIYISPLNSKVKIYIINNAHKMRTEGANAMLKSLEELREYVKIIFTTTNADLILPTIRSRCQLVRIGSSPGELDIDRLALYRLVADTYQGKIETFYKNKDFLDGFREDREILLDGILELFKKILEKNYRQARLDSDNLYIVEKFDGIGIDSLERIILCLEEIKSYNKVNINYDLAIEKIFFTIFREGNRR